MEAPNVFGIIVITTFLAGGLVYGFLKNLHILIGSIIGSAVTSCIWYGIISDNPLPGVLGILLGIAVYLIGFSIKVKDWSAN